MEFSTNGKTIGEVIDETRIIIKKYKTKAPKGSLYYIKRYQDCTAIIESKDTGKLYVNQLYNLYGPFKTLELCSNFRRILKLNSKAFRQVEINSW